jgi:hypothetical protein
VLTKGGSVIGKASRFLGGTIFWSGRTGAFEVHGGIGLLYEQLGGPAGSLGFPLTNETRVTTASGETRFNDFERGIIVWRSHLGARAITKLAFHIGQVNSGSIDDGVEFLGKDRTAELITFTTIEINGTALETRVRRPGGHAGSSHDINRRFTADTIRHDSRIRSRSTSTTGPGEQQRLLGTLDRTFDIDTWWGLLAARPRRLQRLPATRRAVTPPASRRSSSTSAWRTRPAWTRTSTTASSTSGGSTTSRRTRSLASSTRPRSATSTTPKAPGTRSAIPSTRPTTSSRTSPSPGRATASG